MNLEEATKYILDEAFGEVRSSPRWKTFSEAEQQERIDRATRRAEQSAEKLLAAINIRDIQQLELTLHIGNPASRKIFESITKTKLGKTERATRESIRQWVGVDIYDAFKSEQRRIRDEGVRLQKEKAENTAREQALKESVRYCPPGGGVVRTITMREAIDNMVVSGFTRAVDGKRGKFSTLDLTNGKTRFTLRKKYHIEYARKKLLELGEPPENPALIPENK